MRQQARAHCKMLSPRTGIHTRGTEKTVKFSHPWRRTKQHGKEDKGTSQAATAATSTAKGPSSCIETNSLDWSGGSKHCGT